MATERTRRCVCGHDAESHREWKFNCLATWDGIACHCEAFTEERTDGPARAVPPQDDSQ